MKEQIGMPEKFYTKIFKLGPSGAITIPKEIMTVNGWKPGTTIAVWIKKIIEK